MVTGLHARMRCGGVVEGKVESMTGLTRPAAISGKTLASTARAMAPLSATERARTSSLYGSAV